MNIKAIERFYDIASDFDDSLTLIALLLIFNKEVESDFVEIKEKLCTLDFKEDMIDKIERLSLEIPSADMARLIRLIAPIDGLFAREKPRDIPKPIAEGRKDFTSNKKIKTNMAVQVKKNILTTPTLF